VIHLARDTANSEVILTLNEKTTLAVPVFLIFFTNNVTQQTNSAIITDVSGFKARFNEFTITESETQDRVNGTLTLRPDGFWTYQVYEQSSASNLDPDLATTLVETGRANVTSVRSAKSTHTKSTIKPAHERV